MADGRLQMAKGAASNEAVAFLDARLCESAAGGAPRVGSFREYLVKYARVPLRGGAYGPFSFEGRAPLEFIVFLVDQVIANCLHGKTVTIAGTEFAPGRLKGSTISVGGGAQFGKTVLVLNFQGFATFVEFVNFGYYTPDLELLAKIVDTKFRPDVIDQQPWMATMITVGKAENASGKAVNRKNSYQASDGLRKSFGHFCGMQKPPTTISLDAAALDEVDDIPARNMGYVDGRMTGSPLQLKLEIGTQRVAGAGQNARVKAGAFFVRMYRCACGKEWCLEEEWPRIVRKAESGKQKSGNGPSITPEMGHDRGARYYCGCPECGAELDRDLGEYRAKNPHRIKDAHFSVRVSQLNISAISLQEIVGSWYAAMEDPSGESMVAFYCDRIGIPNAGAAQPITQAVLDQCRGAGKSEGRNPKSEYQGYAMSLTRGEAACARVAGMDMGPRCWLWADEVRSPVETACVWAELIASGSATSRVPLLMDALGISCLFMDAGGEPDLTKRLVLALNGLENYLPPVMPRAELVRARLSGLGAGLSWDGERALWRGLRAAAVLFVAGEARGCEQTVGFTQEGHIYPLIKCNRGESIQTAVNDFLTPREGVIEMVIGGQDLGGGKVVRSDRRVRLPETYIGPGVSQAVLDGHLLNVRKERDARTGAEDWVDQVENHLGLAKTYARLAALVVEAGARAPDAGRFVLPSGKRAESVRERRDRSVMA